MCRKYLVMFEALTEAWLSIEILKDVMLCHGVLDCGALKRQTTQEQDGLLNL